MISDVILEFLDNELEGIRKSKGNDVEKNARCFQIGRVRSFINGTMATINRKGEGL